MLRRLRLAEIITDCGPFRCPSGLRQPVARLLSADAQKVDTVFQEDTPISSNERKAATKFHAAPYRPPLGSTLQRYGRDLTAAALEGRLDPLIGRSDVVQRVLQILLRRTKNNPVLIGDPGVGKTAVAEGVAQLAASPSAPPALRGRSIVSLDLGALVAGTQYRGAFEERLQGILSDVRAASGRIILFIDEVHMLMDAGRVEGGMNAANLLKPALARGDLRCMGATTVEEYRKHIEPDAAFSRRLQPVMVEEPSAEEAVMWLEGLRGRYERHHGVRYSDDAVPAAVAACQRFVPDRRLPDGAIDLLDEAASRVQLRHAAMLAELSELGLSQTLNNNAIDNIRNSISSSRESVGNKDSEDIEASEASVSSKQGQGNVQQQVPSERHHMPPHQHQPQWNPAWSVGERGPDEARQLLEWFGATPEEPLPGYAGHRQTAAARQQAYVRQFGQGRYSAAQEASREDPDDPDAPRQRGYGGGGLPCPHCGTPTPSIKGAQTVQCPRCSYRFLNIPPEKLMLGSSLFIQQRLKKAQQEMELQARQSAAFSENEAEMRRRALEKEEEENDFFEEEADVPIVGASDVLEVVAGAAGIPLEQVLSAQSNWRTLEELESSLLQEVHGQPHALHSAASCVRLGLALGAHSRRRRPLASMLLTGPAGVGKGTLCRALSELLFGSDRALLRFDLAQCTDKTAVSRLIGAPPGFVGFGDGGALTEAVRRRPHSVVVFEHANLAHPDVLSLLRQILEDGKLTDTMGKHTDFRNAVVVLTISSGGKQAAVVSNKVRRSQQTEGTSIVKQGTSVTTVADRQVPGDTTAESSTSGGGATHHAAHRSAAAMPYPEEEIRGRQQQQGNGQGSSTRATLPEDLASLLDSTIEFVPLGKKDMHAIARSLAEESTPALEEQGASLRVSDAALAVAAEHALAVGGSASALQTAVRTFILGPAVEAMVSSFAKEGAVKREIVVDADASGKIVCFAESSK